MTNKSQQISDFRRKRKQNLIKILGSQCSICGYNYCEGALEFHHINPEDKEYAIASDGTCHNIEKDLQEIKKCILVCANCHREIHHSNKFKDINLFQFQIYDENFANSLVHQDKRCLSCNKIITRYSKSGLCSDCSHKIKSKVIEKPTRDELKNLIRNFSFISIAKKYNVSDNAIRKWCDKENLPRKKTEINKISDKDWLLL